MAATRLQALVDINREKGRKKRILINTYADPAARHYDQVILIRPGTDGALALAIMHVLEKEGLSDQAFLRTYTEGYEIFRATLDPCTPEWAEKETGVRAKVIRQLAREYAAAKAPAVILGSGNSRYGNGGMTVRLIVIMSLFTGAWQYPGGGLCGCTPVDTAYVDTDLISRPDFRSKKEHRTININQLASALAGEDGQPVRSLYVYGANPANTVSCQDRVIKGLRREDLFTVVHERFVTETALYADIILPATFSAEQHDIYRCYGYCTLGTAKPVVRASGDCKSNWDTFCLLAAGMGYEEDYFARTEEEMLACVLNHPTRAVRLLPEEKKRILREGGSISMPFSDHLKVGTSSGRFRIVNEGLPDPVPCYMLSYSGREALEDEKYPIHLLASPSVYSLNSEFRDREDLMALRGPQKLIIHTLDARQRRIKNGQIIEAYNDLSCVRFKAVVTDNIARGTAVCEGIYRRDCCSGGRAFNALTSERLSDMGEGTTLNDNRVQIRPISHGPSSAPD